MATIDELRARAELISEEQQIGGNTAERVGEAFDMVADIEEAIDERVQDLECLVGGRAVTYDPQTPTSEEQAQARENINAQESIADIDEIRAGSEAGATAYQLPQGGIPETDMAADVQAALAKARTAYQKPATGISYADLNAALKNQITEANDNEVIGFRYAQGNIYFYKPLTDGTFGTTAYDATDIIVKHHHNIALYDITNNLFYFPLSFDVSGAVKRYKYFRLDSSITFGFIELIRQGATPITSAYVAANVPMYTKAQVDTLLAGKQPTIADLDAIRAGAAEGATAYQKPASGIPASDMAQGVQDALQAAEDAAPQATTYTKSETDSLLAQKQGTLTFDNTPTEGSTNPVTSGGIKTYVDTHTPTITMDDAPSASSSNPVKSSGIYSALQTKQNSADIATINGSDITHGGNVTIVAAEGQTITIDATPTEGSSNVVSSGGVVTYVNGFVSEYSETTLDLTIKDNNFYRQDLSMGSSTNYNCVIVSVVGADFTSIEISASPNSGGWVSVTDASDNVLWQSNVASNFPKVITKESYPSVGKLYVSNDKRLQGTPSVKLVSDKDVKTIISEQGNAIESIGKRLNDVWLVLFKKELIPNNYNASELFTFPSDFGTFRVPVKISRDADGVVGWDINPSVLRKDNASAATYYVSTNGDDTADGLTPTTPLKTIDTAVAKSDVNTIILLSGEYIEGEHFTAGLQIAKEINLIGDGYGQVIVKSVASHNPIEFLTGVYVQDIAFSGGYHALSVTLHEELCIFNRCKFLNSSGGNGLTALGGTLVLNQCEASNNFLDGFNYHSWTDSGVACQPNVIELNCWGYGNGIPASTYINNGSTMHSGGKIVRIFCEYQMSRGVNVADADGAKAINFSVVGGQTMNIDGTDNRRASFGSQGSGSKVWMYDCSAYGSKYDVTIDSGSYIYTTRRYPRELVNGTITEI